MERRKAIASAGAATAVAVTAVIAVGANVGIFGLTRQDSKVGRFPLVDTTTTTVVGRATPGGVGIDPNLPVDDDGGREHRDGRELEGFHDEDD
jgi:hypothetical protein